MGYRLVTAPGSYPVSTASAKAQCRVDHDDENTLIEGLIAAATDYVELYLGRALVSQTWELVLDDFSDEILIGKGPVSSITSVKYYDPDGVEQTLSSSTYSFDATADPQRITLNPGYSWPSIDEGVAKITIRFVCGYSTVPAPIKQAMLLLIAQWYDNRADATDRPMIAMPNAVAALLTNYRNFSF